jgi:hypothetical protein
MSKCDTSGLKPAISSSPVYHSATMLSELLVEGTFFANLISTRTLFYFIHMGKYLSIWEKYYPVQLNCKLSHTANFYPTRKSYFPNEINIVHTG